MYSCACSLSSNPIDLCTVIICECSQREGKTALMWASYGGHSDTVRVLVELGASVEAVDKVNIHAHALACTCVYQACVWDYEDDDHHHESCVHTDLYIFMYVRMYVCMHIFMCI
jgi:hypothetical protein